jgi:hypothetical protein
MTLDKSGKLWRGEDFADYIREFQAEGYPVSKVAEVGVRPLQRPRLPGPGR